MNSDIKISFEKCEICINNRNNDSILDSFLRSSNYNDPFHINRTNPIPIPNPNLSTNPNSTQNTNANSFNNPNQTPNTTQNSNPNLSPNPIPNQIPNPNSTQNINANSLNNPNQTSNTTQNPNPNFHFMNLMETILTTLPPENFHLEVQDLPFHNYMSNDLRTNSLSISDIMDGTTLSVIEEDDSGNEENCAICKNSFVKNNIIRKINNCSHKFHCECIDKWFTTHNNCPICRATL